MLVKELDENVIEEIGHAFGYYDDGAKTEEYKGEQR